MPTAPATPHASTTGRPPLRLARSGEQRRIRRNDDKRSPPAGVISSCSAIARPDGSSTNDNIDARIAAAGRQLTGN
ncbi:hypothetical protein P4233_01670 [Pseudomonas aeruginosa]|nr:hypothetical protein [Pseudomonas aeruginosa]